MTTPLPVFEFPPFSLPSSQSDFDDLLVTLEQGRERYLRRGILTGRRMRIKAQYVLSSANRVSESDMHHATSSLMSGVPHNFHPVPHSLPETWNGIDLDASHYIRLKKAVRVGVDCISQVYNVEIEPLLSTSGSTSVIISSVEPTTPCTQLVAKLYISPLFPFPSPDLLDGTPEGTFDNDWRYASQWAAAECAAYDRLRRCGIEGALSASSVGFFKSRLNSTTAKQTKGRAKK
ncbi:hypothetical protein GYMLUDRAFT_612602 [Collybiopsis luxurians FD-317 M1]|uniref:Uncharacterized protein n=1 Tax=Collybiopsis luxurians FD-317 M1 TaxID=944289 RepID=A0A0D0BWV3_9AGAR|nr:hypothetical protein GYMLUDRAFT_612602 [Collybiopsis luxurians FD-317 M1]